MSPAASRYLGLVADSLFGEDPEAHALMTRDDGTVLAGGEATRNPALADVLEELADDGAALFTTGRVGRALVDVMRDDGLVTAADLAAYSPWCAPRTRSPWATGRSRSTRLRRWAARSSR